jgi:hypothetical protein
MKFSFLCKSPHFLENYVISLIFAGPLKSFVFGLFRRFFP